MFYLCKINRTFFDMNAIFIAYLILFFSCLLSGCFVFVLKKQENILSYVGIFGGAFLLAVCFVHLLPEALTLQGETHLCCEDSHHHSHSSSFLSVGVFVLLGFVLQLVLELLSNGAEHGHIHDENHHSEHNYYIKALMILLGVSIHAFLEGFALVVNGEVNYSLLIGVVLHNIPIAMLLVNAFMLARCSWFKSFLFLSVFAIMGVLGSISSICFEFLHDYMGYVIGFVVGILLHVSISTLFDSKESHKYNFVRFIVVIIAFALAVVLSH
jgi:zinc transporter ZupT